MSAGYVFADRTGESLHQQLVGHLADMLDEHSMEALAGHVTPGIRCLAAGAGASGIPEWLVEGGGAEVIATDLEPGPVPVVDGVTVLRHDITTDPLPGVFGLVHARALLAHLPGVQVLDRLVAALDPDDGTVVIEDFDPCWSMRVLSSPDPDASRLVDAYQAALMSTMQAAGTSTTWARELPGAMEAAGLVDVEVSWWATRWRGGTAGCMLPYTMLEHRRDALVEAGMAPPDVDHLRELLPDPRLVITNTAIVTAVGHREVGR